MTSPARPRPPSALTDIVVVLVRTRGPVNLGAVARLCANYGCTMRLVRPETDPTRREARMFASHSDEILDAAPTFESLDEALRDCAVVIGTSANTRRGRPSPVLTPEHAAHLLEGISETGRAALVFGDERDGLFQEELERCHHVVRLHSPGPHPSFNLSHAVALTLQCVALAHRDSSPLADARPDLSALSALEDKWMAALEAAGYFKRTDPRVFKAERLRPLLGRLSLRAKEVSLLEGMFAVLERAALRQDPADRVGHREADHG